MTVMEVDGVDCPPLVSAFEAGAAAAVVAMGVAAVDVIVSPLSRRDDSSPTVPLASSEIPLLPVAATTGLDRFRASPPPPPPPRPFARCRRPCTLSSPADAARPRQARATTTTMMNEIRLPPAPNPACARGMLLFAIATFIRLFRLLD
jgi:hypothetical protein